MANEGFEEEGPENEETRRNRGRKTEDEKLAKKTVIEEADVKP